jgi:hypothetical protein
MLNDAGEPASGPPPSILCDSGTESTSAAPHQCAYWKPVRLEPSAGRANRRAKACVKAPAECGDVDVSRDTSLPRSPTPEWASFVARAIQQPSGPAQGGAAISVPLLYRTALVFSKGCIHGNGIGRSDPRAFMDKRPKHAKSWQNGIERIPIPAQNCPPQPVN